MDGLGKSEKDLENMKKTAWMSYLWSALGTLVSAFLLEWIVFSGYGGVNSYTTAAYLGADVGFWVCLAFVLPPMLSETLFSGKSMKIFWGNAGYQLISFVVMGIIISLILHHTP